ncbi:hypothetical protein BB561_004617 [Smittium simulii]|uniref:Cyclin-like domain-containing protein n=1 Tax=Smittium simulii TaxID=133385 RepID=A0A2T9YF74_9FUNG|nr:hypothetical protein BB561_004617 [Smittium simulii]
MDFIEKLSIEKNQEFASILATIKAGKRAVANNTCSFSTSFNYPITNNALSTSSILPTLNSYSLYHNSKRNKTAVNSSTYASSYNNSYSDCRNLLQTDHNSAYLNPPQPLLSDILLKQPKPFRNYNKHSSISLQLNYDNDHELPHKRVHTYNDSAQFTESMLYPNLKLSFPYKKRKDFHSSICDFSDVTLGGTDPDLDSERPKDKIPIPLCENNLSVPSSHKTFASFSPSIKHFSHFKNSFVEHNYDAAYDTLIFDTYSHLFSTENTNIFNPIANHALLNTQMRPILIDWLFEVSADYKLHRHTCYLGIYLFDNFLRSSFNVAPTKLQLYGAASLFIAVKMEETKRISLSEMTFIAQGAFTTHELKAAEIKVLTAANWSLVVPTIPLFISAFCLVSPLLFLPDCTLDSPNFASFSTSKISSLAQSNTELLLEYSCEFADICIHDNDSSLYKASVIAASCFYLACIHLSNNNILSAANSIASRKSLFTGFSYLHNNPFGYYNKPSFDCSPLALGVPSPVYYNNNFRFSSIYSSPTAAMLPPILSTPSLPAKPSSELKFQLQPLHLTSNFSEYNRDVEIPRVHNSSENTDIDHFDYAGQKSECSVLPDNNTLNRSGSNSTLPSFTFPEIADCVSWITLLLKKNNLSDINSFYKQRRYNTDLPLVNRVMFQPYHFSLLESIQTSYR